MVPTKDPEVIKDIFQKLFDELFADDVLAENLLGINKVVKIKYVRPEVVMYLDFKDNGSKVMFQPEAGLEPVAFMEMDWETGHKLWSGNLDLIPALMTERIRVGGEVEQFVSLRSMYGRAIEIYKNIINNLP